jgi:hypothetical protein
VNTEDDIVEEYLDELFVALRGQPRQVRRMLAETEEHLRLAIIDDLARGTPAEDATVAAVARFGGAAEVARAWNASTPAEPMPTFLRRLAAQLVPLAGTGLIAIGLSGVIARIMTALWGRTFMFADPPGTTYPAAACRSWLSLHPSAASCTNAYLAEAQADGLLARYAAGVLGLVLLGVVVIIRRRRGLPIFGRLTLLSSFTATVVFLGAALGLLGLGVDSIRTSGSHGAGQWLSGAVIALPLAVAYSFTFLRSARRSSVLT